MPRHIIRTEDLPAIQEMYVAGATSYEIAERYQCDPTAIQYCLHKTGCIRPISDAKRQYHVREDAFAEVSDEATAYWLGFLYADGCVLEAQGIPQVLALWLAEKDRAHVEHCNGFLASDYPIRYDAKRRAHGVTIWSRALCQDLIRWGCTPRKSGTLRWPDIPLALDAHFVRGYVDGDGSAFTTGRYSTPVLSILGNDKLIESLSLAIYYGTNATSSTHRHSKSRNAYYLVFHGEYAAKAVGDWMYRDATCGWSASGRSSLDFANRATATIPQRCGISDSASTAGNVSQQTIQRYIAAQTGR
jgi:hypothetical protein